jgi:hypothetical protein
MTKMSACGPNNFGGFTTCTTGVVLIGSPSQNSHLEPTQISTCALGTSSNAPSMPGNAPDMSDALSSHCDCSEKFIVSDCSIHNVEHVYGPIDLPR